MYPDGIKRMNDFLGATVQLIIDCETKVAEFKRGEHGKVVSHHRGRIKVEFNDGRVISQLDRMAVKLVKELPND